MLTLYFLVILVWLNSLSRLYIDKDSLRKQSADTVKVSVLLEDFSLNPNLSIKEYLEQKDEDTLFKEQRENIIM